VEDLRNDDVTNVDEATEAAVSEDTVAADIAELSQAELQRDEYLAALQQLQADFENYRKRVARASEESAVRAAGALAATMLPVLDAFDLAVAHFEGSTSEEATALVQSRSLLLDTLAKQGLERVDQSGVAFDPTVHDAVAHEEGDGEQVVDAMLRAGYKWKGSVLRPAMVRVKG
jgi:molecular chaperone GrpE